MTVPTLETDRLVLRGFVDDDLDRFAPIVADREVMRWLGDGRPLTRAEAWRTMATFIGHWVLRGYGQWAVVEKATGMLVGRVGPWNPAGWPGLELGWLIDRAHWGRGFATEGARAALGWMFEALGAERVISLIEPENVRSVRVAERIGERYERTITLEPPWCEPRSVAMYAVERTHYRAAP